jgi:signal transduction histidine kinase
MQNKDFNVLIIEDEPSVCESYLDMLDVIGFSAETAANGKEGLKKLAQKNYNIVITDLNMPVMDGQETLKRIKQKYTGVEVIVITGFATIETAIKAMKDGAFDYITKPVSLEHVKIVMNRCVQHIKAAFENAELRSVNTQLRQINEIKDKFITITNHELRTPLAVMKGYMELVDLSIDEKSPDVQEYLEIVTNTLKEMIDLVERMHNLQDNEKAFSQTVKSVVNLNDVILNVANEMKILFKQRDIHFSAYTNSKEIILNSDRNGIHRVVRELLQNALKFTKEGGKVALNVKKELSDQKVYISVEDNGIGIPTDKIDYIFEPFYEVQDVMHHSTSQTEFMGGGIGVGLSLVREILQSLGADISVTSEINKGSTFTIIMPYELQPEDEETTFKEAVKV